MTDMKTHTEQAIEILDSATNGTLGKEVERLALTGLERARYVESALRGFEQNVFGPDPSPKSQEMSDTVPEYEWTEFWERIRELRRAVAAEAAQLEKK